MRSRLRSPTPILGGVAAALLLTALLSGCTNQPSASELQALRREANQDNQRMLAALASSSPDTESATGKWTLTISGQIGRSRPEVISLVDLARLASRRVSTWDPNNSSSSGKVKHYQGVLISELFNRVGADREARDITFVSTDAFRTTVPMADIIRHPIILANREGGKPIERSSGGPIYLVFPYLDSPELVTRYPDRFWAFYVTHVIVGTEPVAVRVGPRLMDAGALQALPQALRTWPVGFRGFWPHTPVRLKGVRVADVLQAAGLRGRTLIVRGKAQIHTQVESPVAFPWQDIRSCELMLVTASGPLSESIPARLGGPVVLAIAPRCRGRYFDRSWVTFVSALEVQS
ncbi:MAG: molybdopterin-dependent oxidoreductase [Cyanobium sp.]